MLEVKDVVLFREGKNDRMVAYDHLGKVVFAKHKVTQGYYEVDTLEDKGNYFVVTGHKVLYDYYRGMGYNEFLQLLPKFGFKIGFDRSFIYKCFDSLTEDMQSVYINKKEHQIFAYNLEYNVCLTAETWNNGRTFNEINVSCPGITQNMPIYSRMLWCSGGRHAKFNLVNHGRNEKPLHFIMNLMQTVKEKSSTEWSPKEDISLWTYADERISGVEFDLWDRTIDRILLAPAEVEQIFKNCKRMQPVFAKRNAKQKEAPPIETNLF